MTPQVGKLLFLLSCVLVGSGFAAAGVSLFRWGRENADWVCVFLGAHAILTGVTVVLTALALILF